MMEPENGLFSSLFKWAHRQDENFTSEAFVFLLKYLQENDQISAVSLLNFITNYNLNLDYNSLKSVQIETQTSTSNGRPDIVISSNDFLVFIEVKRDSGFGEKQLSRYKTELGKQTFKRTLLGTLTRFPLSYYQVEINEMPDFELRWHQINDFLDRIKFNCQTSEFLKSDFQSFLKWSNLAMEKIGYELVGGLRSFQNLMTMIAEALAAQKIGIYSKSPAWGWYGYYLENKKLFVGVYYDWPNAIQVTSEDKIKVKDGTPLSFGFVEGGKWKSVLDLESEEIHFFSRTAQSQVQCLEKFIKENVDFALATIL